MNRASTSLTSEMEPPSSPLPQPDRLRRDDPGGGHAGHLQARTLHLRRVGIRWSSLLAASQTPHVLPKLLRAIRRASQDIFAASNSTSQTPPVLHREWLPRRTHN